MAKKIEAWKSISGRLFELEKDAVENDSAFRLREFFESVNTHQIEFLKDHESDMSDYIIEHWDGIKKAMGES